MFFSAEKLILKRDALVRQPPIPETGWRPPQSFPNLTTAKFIGIDTETKETDFDHGPGWARGQGHIIGFSVAAIASNGETGKWYFPVRHEVETGYNLPASSCFGWLRETLATPHIPKIGANLLYDLGWLSEESITVQGELHDVQFAQALIDEESLTALEYLAETYLGEHKTTVTLYDWLARAYGGQAGPKQRANLWRAPPRLVGPYAEDDADLPMRLIPKQWEIMERENMTALYRMECNAIPMLIKMRQAGVRVDVAAADRLHTELGADIRQLYAQLSAKTGVRVDTVNSSAQLGKLFDAAGLPYSRSPTGKPSFRKEWLKEQSHPLADAINEIRQVEKVRGTFVKGCILEGSTKGRCHTSYHPLRSDDGGAKTGRYASSNPGLQQIPVRSTVGKRVRTLFLPEEGHLCIQQSDHSQIEYRMLAHFATGPGAAKLRAEYQANPHTDYHDRVFQAFCPFAGLDYATMPKEEKAERRKPLKNVNFGLIYGQTEPSLAYKAGMSTEAARGFFQVYHEAAPYVRPTMQAIGNEVQAFGYITTVLGRRVRFNWWEPAARHPFGTPRPKALRYAAALREYGPNIKRAGGYKGTNYKFQGSAADGLKKGMLDCYKSGVFDFTGYPLLQVHDELDFSVKDASPQMDEAYRFITHTLEHALDGLLQVPLCVDSSRGPNWGTMTSEFT